MHRAGRKFRLRDRVVSYVNAVSSAALRPKAERCGDPSKCNRPGYTRKGDLLEQMQEKKASNDADNARRPAT